MAASALLLAVPKSDDPVQAVRRFNRFYTRQIGVLNEHLLQSQFCLTEVRVLYELAHRQPHTAGELCRDLGLDRGYLSRMLRGFEKQGWIKSESSPDDRRKAFLSLTAKGRRVLGPLELRSSTEVSSMLNKLARAQQTRLLAAMIDIERLLSPFDEISSRQIGSESTSASYSLRPHRPGDMGWVVQRHGALYWQEYGYDECFEGLVAGIVAEFVKNLDPARERCWIAEKDGENVGAVFLVKKSQSVAKLRLLLVEPSVRGLGIGKRLVAECVQFARGAGYKKIMLWTQSELAAARRIYQNAGFELLGEEKHQSWSRKDLIGETWELKL